MTFVVISLITGVFITCAIMFIGFLLTMIPITGFLKDLILWAAVFAIIGVTFGGYYGDGVVNGAINGLLLLVALVVLSVVVVIVGAVFGWFWKRSRKT
jgi:hypothetical protein